MKPTDKQLDFIDIIEKTIGKSFDGKTIEDAKKWISDNIDEYNMLKDDFNDEFNYWEIID